MNDGDFSARIEAVERRQRPELERLARVDKPAHEWAALSAYTGRVDSDEDYSSLLHAERLKFGEEVFARLFSRDGLDYLRKCPHRMQLLIRFAPEKDA